jgi:hypothetical protein
MYHRNHQVIVANDFWLLLHKERCKEMFHIVLVNNQQITVGAVATRLVQREQLHRIHMDHQRQLPLMHFACALRATRKPHVLIRIEKEAVKRGLFTQLCYSLLFLICHCYAATPQ